MDAPLVIKARLSALMLAVVLVGAAGLLPAVRPAVASPGDLDGSFGGGGMVTTDLGGVDEARAVTIAGGRLTVAGVSDGGTGVFMLALARYTLDGTLDRSFGNGGIVTTPVGADDAVGNAIAAQPDGKVVVAGYAGVSGTYDVVLARYNTDGSLDTSFGTDGIVVTSIGAGDDLARDVAVDTQGRLIVAGTSAGGGGSNLVLLRYSSDGRLDGSFGRDGIASTPLSGLGGTFDLNVQEEGAVVATIAGDLFRAVFYMEGRFDVRIARTLAPGFDRTNSVTPIGNTLMGIAGVAGGRFAVGVHRYDLPGTNTVPWTEFGGSGLAVADFGQESAAFGLITLTDRRIVAVGQAGFDFAVAVYDGVTPPAAGPPSTPPPATPPPVTGTPPSAMPSPSGPRTPAAGDILLQDNFDDPAIGVMPRSLDDPQTMVGYVSGEYMVRKVRSSQTQSIVFLPNEYRDTTIAIDGRILGEFRNHILLVGCRDTPSVGGYRLIIVPGENRYRIDRYGSAGQRTLADGTSTAVRGGNERNRIEFTCARNILTAVVNGVQVASVSDDSYSQGRLWIGAGPWSGVSALTEGRFDNLVVTQR